MVLAHNIFETKRTTDVQIFQDITFDSMLLSNNTLSGLKKSGFFKPSPIQLHGIPLGKCGFDLLLEAKSGTGKTAVFTIIALEKLDLDKGLQVIMLAPTREIAAQICDVLKHIGCKYNGLHVEVVMGGLPIQDDINKFKNNKVHVVVGSPGRLKHLIQDKHIVTNSVRLLVLDEADKLMEKSFLSDIRFIHSSLPRQKQVILSSATYPDSKELINQFVYGAQHICPSSNCILLGVAQKVTYVKCNNNIVKQTENRFKELLKILTKKQFKQCLIFCNYQARVGELYKMLMKEKWPAEQLCGKQEQTDRLDAIKTLQEYKCRLLISTDLAARGIDASNVDLVINFESPFEWQTYLHRIGRAGRYGSYGMAITILSEGGEAKRFLNLLEALKISINLTPLWDEDIANDDIVDKYAEVPVMCEYSSISKITEENNYIDLWQIICENKSIQGMQENVESFEELFKSFKELEINDIKSFSDLLMSFNNNNLPDLNENCVTQYKYIDIPNITARNYINKINVIKENILNNSFRKETILNSEEQKYKCSNEKLSRAEFLHIENNNIKKEDQVHNKPINDNNSLLYNNNRQIENKSKELNNGENNEIELSRLGLPVAFTSKHTQRPKKTSWSKKKVLSQTEEISNSSDDPIENINRNISRRSYSEFKKTNVKPNQKSNFTNNKPNTNYCKPYKYEVSSCSVSKKINHGRSKESLTNTYINWYNQLKFKVRQIEIALYIDELSKL